MTMYVARDFYKTAGCYTTGHYMPDGKFEPESDHATLESASDRAAFLNGANTYAQKHGNALLEFAAKYGWSKGNGEGPLEYIMRTSYETGVKDARATQRSAVPQGVIDALTYLKNWQQKDGASVVVETATEALALLKGGA